MSQLASREDFPACSLGQHVDLGGFTGVVVQVVRQSLKVASADGTMQSFNVARLRKLHAPAPRPPAGVHEDSPSEPSPEAASRPALPITQVTPAASRAASRKRSKAPEAPQPPAPVVHRRMTEEPNHESEVHPIAAYAALPDFPDAAFGVNLDIAGYVGVLVEIVDQSVKVAAADGNVRRYNIQALRKLYGAGSTS